MDSQQKKTKGGEWKRWRALKKKSKLRSGEKGGDFELCSALPAAWHSRTREPDLPSQGTFQAEPSARGPVPRDMAVPCSPTPAPGAQHSPPLDRVAAAVSSQRCRGKAWYRGSDTRPAAPRSPAQHGPVPLPAARCQHAEPPPPPFNAAHPCSAADY